MKMIMKSTLKSEIFINSTKLGKRHYFLGELLGNTHALRKHHYFLGQVLGNRSTLTKDHLKAPQGKHLRHIIGEAPTTYHIVKVLQVYKTNMKNSYN
jgi:cyanate lyase